MKAEDMNIKVNVDDKAINEALEKAEKLKALTENLTWQNRLRSPVLWTTLTSALLLLLGEWGLYEAIGIKQELMQHTIDFVLLVLTGFGIVNSPDNKNSL